MPLRKEMYEYNIAKARIQQRLKLQNFSVTQKKISLKFPFI
jgi:hypothetical protein